MGRWFVWYLTAAQLVDCARLKPKLGSKLNSRMSVSVESFLDSWLPRLSSSGNTIYTHLEAARPSRLATLKSPLPSQIAHLVPESGLWSHQVEAIEAIAGGANVAIATGTASGKSLCYQLPIAWEIAGDGLPATALALFPTKALSHDQLRALRTLEVPSLVAATYDGDSTMVERRWVQRHANVVLTNPDMLNRGILPYHKRWATFFKRLRFVVIDELHVLRGTFGTHTAHLLRRLRRICELYGGNPTFIFTSATLAGVSEHAEALCGLPVLTVEDDGSPRGERTTVLLDTSGAEPNGTIRSPGFYNTASLVAELVSAGLKTVAFSRSRVGTEVLAQQTRRLLNADLQELVGTYRGGYLPSERREIEARLEEGSLRGVVATSALELGVDIAGLDACVVDGFPGTVASLRQQIGRAGRHAQSSLAIIVAGNDQLDRWFTSHPSELFERPAERVVINPGNLTIANSHIGAAAFEHPLRWEDEYFWGDTLEASVHQLTMAGNLRVQRTPTDEHALGTPQARWSGRHFPARDISMRSTSNAEIRIVSEEGTLVGTVEESAAPRSVHDGAIYIHQGQTYRVIELDLENRLATVRADIGDTYTQPRSVSDVAIVKVDQSQCLGQVKLSLGDVRVRSQVVGYTRKDTASHLQLSHEPLELPESVLETRGFWYEIPTALLSECGLDAGAVPGTLHALEHAAISLLPLFTVCDRSDVGGLSTPLHGDTMAPTIVIYDGYAGGAGVSELGYEIAHQHLPATLELLENCSCVDGCPSCVQSPKCGNGNAPLEKGGAIALLRAIVLDLHGGRST